MADPRVIPGLFVDGPSPRIRVSLAAAGAHKGTGHADPRGSGEVR